MTALDPRLRLLHETAEGRAREAASGRDWPCRKGCDDCCRSLAGPPRLTPPEWEWLREGVSRLDQGTARDVDARVRALGTERPLVCPLLGDDGACLVYLHRPLACRAYGFYRERDRVLGCAEIERRSSAGEWADVVWGNAEALEARQAELGPARDLREWWHSGGAFVYGGGEPAGDRIY